MPDLVQHLSAIESRVSKSAENPGDNHCTVKNAPVTSDACRTSEILHTFERLTVSLSELTDQFRQLQLRLPLDMTNAIDTTVFRARQSFPRADAAELRPTDTDTDFGSNEESWTTIRAAMFKPVVDDSEVYAEGETVPMFKEMETAEVESVCESMAPVEFEVSEPFDCDTINDEDRRGVP